MLKYWFYNFGPTYTGKKKKKKKAIVFFIRDAINGVIQVMVII